MLDFNQGLGWLIPLLIIDAILKGIALWKAARNNQKYWFIALVVINSIGILPIIYLALFQNNNSTKPKLTQAKSSKK